MTVLTGGESDAVSDDFDGRVVEAPTRFGDVEYVLRLFCDSRGSASGFRIVRAERAGVSGTVQDAGRLLGSKLSGLTDDDDEVSETAREQVADVVADLDEYRFQAVHDRLTDELKRQVQASDIRSAWVEYAAGFVEVDEVATRDGGLIEAELRLEEGTSTLTVQFTDDWQLATFRIR